MKKPRWTADEVEEFCGWAFLQRMIEIAKTERDQALVATAFLTGGRISEVLMLQKKHFIFDQDPAYVIVRTMPRVKCYRKIREVDKWKCVGHCHMRWSDEPSPEEFARHNITKYRGWVTKPVREFRTFPFPKSEPLVPVLQGYLAEFTDPEQYLFNIKYAQAYTITTDIGKELGAWIPTHWFRAQRASQLAFEYGFNEHDLVEFFKWQDYRTAFHYASKGYKGLAAKMGSVET